MSKYREHMERGLDLGNLLENNVGKMKATIFLKTSCVY